MGEIKSTLELVLEKTRHLTLTDEEKREMQRKEYAEKLRGLIKKYQEERLDLEQFEKEWRLLQEGTGFTDAEVLTREVLGRIDPDTGDQRLLDLLSRCCGFDTGDLAAAIENYKKEMESESLARQEEIREALSERGVSGSAVVPNLDTDTIWQAKRRAIRERFYQELEPLISSQ